MYIQITTKCNMTCDHCCMSCGRRAGKHMDMEVVRKACQIASEYEEFITIGGGEPTLHPNFMEIFGLVLLSATNDYTPFIVTNGTNKELTLKLLRCKSIQCEVSLDDGYHDSSMVSDEVKELARKQQATRNVRRISKTGRGKNISGAEKICVCNDTFIDVNGNVYLCGCKKHKRGNIMDKDFDIQDIFCNVKNTHPY